MKFVKMSLAAIVAAGALSTVSSAGSLEDAIKNVDITGYGRYRFDSNRNDNGSGNKSTNAFHRFTGQVDFKAALDDNFYAVVGFRFDSRDFSGNHTTGGQTNVGSADTSSSDGYSQTFNVRQFFLGYKAGNTTIQGGRQVLGTFFTDDMVGTGIKVLNTDVTGLTLGAMAFDDLQDDADISSTDLGKINGSYTWQNNLYGLAAIGNYDPISFQLWYAMLENVSQLYAIDITGNFALSDDMSLGFEGQYAGSNMAGKFKDGTNQAAGNADFYAIQGSFEGFGVDAAVGYLDYSTKRDKTSLVSYEDQGSFISPGELLLDYTLFNGKNNYWFVVAGYTFLEKYRVGVDYLNGKNKTLIDSKNSEIVGRLSYAYSKKLNFQTYWAHTSQKPDGGDTQKNDRFRFDAKYSF